MVNNDIYKEILTKLLKVSELKMSTEVTVRNTVLSETDLKITGTLTLKDRLDPAELYIIVTNSSIRGTAGLNTVCKQQKHQAFLLHLGSDCWAE